MTVAGPVLVIATSATAATVLLTVDVSSLIALLSSVVVVVTLAVLLMVEPSRSLLTAWNTTAKVSVLPVGIVVALKLAVLPLLVSTKASGPLIWVSETNVVPVGAMSVRLTLWASDGPALVKVIV